MIQPKCSGFEKSGLEGRCQAVRKLADLIDVRRDEIAQGITRYTGKPILESYQESDKSIAACQFFADSAKGFLQDQLISDETCRVILKHLPLGKILVITPWNYPIWQIIRSAMPAFLAGNRIVIKPSPLVGGCTQLLENSIRAAGIPHEIVSFLPATTDLTQIQLESTGYDAVFFTGSTNSGRSLAAWAGRNLLKLVIELGGSDPYIILSDADLDLAIDVCVKSRFMNAGQRCNAAKRFIVEAGIEAAFTHKMMDRISRLRMGDPLSPGTEIGPLVSFQARDKLHKQVLDSVEMGARILQGGRIPHRENPFYPPTLLADVRPGMPVFDEETFGPVVPISVAENIEDAIQLANLSDYGLGAAVFTRDRDAASYVGENLTCGSFAINKMLETDFRFPFGGTKSSGFGRELGRFGFIESCYVRTEYYPWHSESIDLENS